MKYIIEHLDPDLFEWTELEYKHISDKVGKKNVIFTNVKGERAKKVLKKLGEVHEKSVKEMELEWACVLDPFAKDVLSPEDGEKFDYLIFGGVLGDHPMQGRTGKELTSKMKHDARNIGDVQMSTDTAVIVSKKIVEGIKFEDMHFIEDIEIILDETENGITETNILPYRYLEEENGHAMLTPGLIEYLKKHPFF